MKKMGSIGYGLTSLLVLLALTLSVVGCAGSNPQTTSPTANLALGVEQYDLVFAVAGDSRVWDPKDLNASDYWLDPSKKPDYKQYINTEALRALSDNLSNIWKGSPGFFLMHVGDIGMRGGTPIFNAFKQEMDPLINAGIPVYLTIGNHELRYYKPKSGAESAANTYLAQKEYIDTIGKSMLPPDAEKLSPKYDGGLAYSFKRGDSLFVVLDAYYVNYDNPNNPKYKKGYYSDFQLDKLREILDKNQDMQNIFVFSHQPAFNADGGAGKFYNKYDKDSTNCARANWILWALLDKYEVDVFFCGHSHFYHRWNVSGPKFGNKWDTDNWRAVGSDFPDLKAFVKNYGKNKPPWENEIPQVVTGSCGAPTQKAPVDSSVPANYTKSVYNYSIVQVKGNTITVEVYRYGYTKPETDNNTKKTIGNNVMEQPTLIDKFQKQGDQWKDLPIPAQDVLMKDESGAVEDESGIEEYESGTEEDESGA